MIKGIDVADLVLEIRREMRFGLNAFLVLVDGEPQARTARSGDGDRCQP